MKIIKHFKLSQFYAIINLLTNYASFLSNSIFGFNIIWRNRFSCIICLIPRFVKFTSWLILDNRSILFIINIRNSWFRIYIRLNRFRYIWSRITFFFCFFNRYRGLILLRSILVWFFICLNFILNWWFTFFIILSILLNNYFCLWIIFFSWFIYFSTWCFSLYYRSNILNIFFRMYCFFVIILFSNLNFLFNRFWWFFWMRWSRFLMFWLENILVCFFILFCLNFIFKWLRIILIILSTCISRFCRFWIIFFSCLSSFFSFSL